MPNIEINFERTEKQRMFMEATQFEVLYGGAAGGGKSHGQLMDAILYALRYEGSNQLIFRRTFPDLEKSLIRKSREMIPEGVAQYNSSTHTWKFINGSVIDFGYLASDGDVYQYQSAEYDVIRFDELTHFTEFQYTYMISRVRGGKPYPRSVKSSTNPGGVGHAWVKKRFIDPAPPMTEFIGDKAAGTTAIFIPSLAIENTFLMRGDPTYVQRLKALPETEMKALLYGEWDLFEGQFFDEFDKSVHVIKPFPIPSEWRRYRVFDYGLDRLACLWVAIDSTRDVYVYREYCESNLTISTATEKILAHTAEDEEIYETLAPPDLWSRSQESGRSREQIFYENGLLLTKSSNDREAGCLALKELLKLDADGNAHIHIFETCRELITCLPALVYDEKNPNVYATEPHEYTHVVDACRYYAVSWARPDDRQVEKRVYYTEGMLEDWMNAENDEQRAIIERAYGGKPLDY